MNDSKDAPARYSDEANLEPTARASEVTPEVETELPEAGARGDADEDKPTEHTWEGPMVFEGTDADIMKLAMNAAENAVAGLLKARITYPTVTASVTVKLSREASDRLNEWLRSEELRRRGSGE
jgi:hypothetical protein